MAVASPSIDVREARGQRGSIYREEEELSKTRQRSHGGSPLMHWLPEMWHALRRPMNNPLRATFLDV